MRVRDRLRAAMLTGAIIAGLLLARPAWAVKPVTYVIENRAMVTWTWHTDNVPPHESAWSNVATVVVTYHPPPPRKKERKS